SFEAGGGRWIRTTEGVSQQIYSLPPLAAWVSLRNFAGRPYQPLQRARYSGGHFPDCQRIFTQKNPSARNRPPRSDVEAEMQDVALLHAVLLALQAQAAGVARAGFAPVLDEVVVADGLGADEALLEVGMDDRGGLRRGGAGLDRP